MPANVTLDRLFRPTMPFEIYGKQLTIRALSEPEQTSRSMYATNQGRKIEKELEDINSDIYQFRIYAMERMSAEALQEVLRRDRETDFRRDTEREKPPVYQPFPDEATEEEKRAVMNEREESEVKRKALIDETVKKQTAEFFDKFLKDKTQPELFEIAKGHMSESLILERANMAFAHYTLYCAVMDKNEQYFASPAEVAMMKDEVVFSMYRVAQEVNGIDPLALSGPA